MNATSRIRLDWKVTFLGLLVIALSVLAALLLHRYPTIVRAPMWAIYGSCIAVASLGFATVVLSLAHRRVALVFYIIFLTGAIGIAAVLGLAKAVGKCKSGIAGVTVANPELVCEGAYAAGIIGGAVLLCYFMAGFLGRQNAA